MPKKENVERTWKGTNIYLSWEALDVLNDTKIDLMGVDIKKNTDKIKILCNFYNENKRK